MVNESTMRSLITNLQSQCNQSRVEFVNFYQLSPKRIASSKKKYFLSIVVHDLISNDHDFFKQLSLCLIENNKQLLLCTDNLCSRDNFPNIKIVCHPTLIGLNYLHVDIDCYNSLEDNQPKKLFNSFFHRTESNRQSWLYFLYHYNLIDQGYVSYLCSQLDDYSTLRGLNLYDYIHYNFKLGNVEHFEKAYHALRPQVPFQNFEENGILTDKILDSKYSLVVDTYAVDDHSNFRFISEKICRALMIPCCQLFFVQQNTLKILTDTGLEISQSNLDFDHLGWIQRQQRILEILTNDSDVYDFKYLKSRALHNYNVFKSMHTTNIDQFYNNMIDMAQTEFN